MPYPRNPFQSALLLLLALGSQATWAQSYVAFERKAAYLPLVAGKSLPLLVSAEDYPGVVRAATITTAAEVKQFYDQDSLLSHYYNHTLAGGKWDHMMDQPHVFYNGWRGPDREVMPKTMRVTLPPAPEMAVAVEGSADWWPQATTPAGRQQVPLTLTGPGGQRITVQVPADNNLTASELRGAGYVAGDGYVSIAADHYTQAIHPGNTSWQVLNHYGRTSTGVTLLLTTAGRQTVTATAPHLEYLPEAGPVNLLAYVAPTIDFHNDGGLIYAVAFDDEALQFVNLSAKKPAESWVNDNSEKAMKESINFNRTTHQLVAKGTHTLKFWMITSGVVLQKLVIDAGGLRPSYLGPPESYRADQARATE